MQRDQGERMVGWNSLRVSRAAEPSEAGSRLDFRHISNHLSRKQPGYYLILLRNELRHRSLREKLGWEVRG